MKLTFLNDVADLSEVGGYSPRLEASAICPWSQTRDKDSKTQTSAAFACESNNPGTVQNAMRHGRRQVREFGGGDSIVAD